MAPKKMFKVCGVSLSLFFALCLFSSDLRAEKVKLKSGREISGRLLDITDSDVVLFAGGGKMWFGRDKVESINGLSVEEFQGTLLTAKAFVTDDKEGTITASIDEGYNYVSKTRKLEFKSRPQVEIITREALKANLKAEIDKEYSKDDLVKRGKLLMKLGLVSSVNEYEESVLDMAAEQAAGYYDPKNKKIYVTKDIEEELFPGMPSMTILHEQVHALQDEYFNLEKIRKGLKKENEDRQAAMHSVIEGEATVLMFDAFLRSTKTFGYRHSRSVDDNDIRSFILETMLASSKYAKDKSGKPAIFMEDLLFPYFGGGVFIQHTVNTKGWEQVSALYEDPPVSSEQIMHPEKYYIYREAPQEVGLPDLSGLLGEAWVKLSEDVLGELGFYLIGKNFLEDLSVKIMHEGWGGDKYALYENKENGKLLFICLARWDSTKDADEFFDLYKKVLHKKYKTISVVQEEASLSHLRCGGEDIYIKKSGEAVLIIEGTGEQLTGQIAQEFKI